MDFRRLTIPALLGLQLLLSPAPAAAQLAPGSAWQASKWDFSNLYQGTTTTPVKPEILMLLDDTGSTSRLMFHPLFPINWQDENPPNSPPTADSYDYSLLVKFTAKTGSGAYPQYPTSGPPLGISVGFTTNGSGGSIGTVQASGQTYTIGGARTLVTGSDGNTYPVNTLIKPNGTEVTSADVPSAHSAYTTVSNGKDDPVNWILCASHVRLACTVGSVTRIIDFPLSFVPLDPSATLSNTGTSPATGPLTPAVATDPNTGDTYPFDTESFVNVNSTSSPGFAYMNGGFYSNGYIRSRYIEWVFWGQDPGSTGGTAYCIPNAIPSTQAAAMFADDPALNTYNGAAGVWQTGGTTTTAHPAFTNSLPNRTRGQAIKECVIKTWLGYSGQVMLAIRTLADTGTTCSNAITANVSGSTIQPTAAPAFGSTNWFYMDPTQIATQVPAFAACQWSDGDSTPLTASTLSSLCQMTNPAAFAPLIAANGYTQAQLQCQHHFLVVLTDGAPYEGTNPAESTSANFPYYQTTAPPGSPALSGNTVIRTSPAGLTGNGSAPAFWNMATLAGMAAHGGEGSSSTPTWIRDPLTEGLTGSLTNLTSGSGWAPLWVTRRTVGGTAFTLTNAQPVQTMTVGVSLGVDYYAGSSGTTALGAGTAPNLATRVVPILTDTTGSKFRLLYTAYFGDPSEDNYNIAAAVPFYLAPGTVQKSADAAYFFDGRDPATLVSNLSSAFQQITLKSIVNSVATPVFPTLGAGSGQEIYVGTFLPPTNPGPMWSGDLLMYPTQATGAGSTLLDSNGNPLTGTTLSALNAQWSAAAAIATRGWTNRVIYSRPPATSSNWNPGLVRVNLGTNGTGTGNAGYVAIQPYLPGSNATLQLENWQFYVGADVGGGTTPLPTRATILPNTPVGNPPTAGIPGLMGDVIDSAPTALQYSTLPSSVASASPVLSSAWSAHNPANTTGDTSGAFRMIFVGDNQGLMHAFGEVSWITNPTNSSGVTLPVTTGVVDEIWAFAPTEILPNINQLQVSTNLHYYAVDGAPTVYLLDLPQSASQSTGDGIFDVGATYAPERAVLIFGLGKGGRSYYAINIGDPGNPTMQWALCPNEQYNYPAARILGGSASVIANMGLGTPQPTLARVATSTEGTTNQIVDAVLLGGGYSDSRIEAALPATATTTPVNSTPAVNTLLGRGALAVDVWTGNILNTWSLTGVSGAGPVTTSVVPVVLTPGSGIVDRGYFTDYYGSLWAVGGTTAQASPYTMFRTDTAIVDNWSVRQVYTQPVTSGSPGNGLLTSAPALFLLNAFPVTRTTAPLVSPMAVGVAFETGDRNNPLDKYTYTPWSAPAQHRLNVLFDRQDINSVISAGGLADATSSSFSFSNPSASNYYLANNYGYFVNLPAPSGGFVPKGFTTPLLLDGTLFYSFFNPTTSTCAGGTGTTSTLRVCNVMAPAIGSSFNTTVAATATAVNGCQSGLVLSWTGVASNMAAQSIITGVQAGLTSGSGTNNNTTAAQNLAIQNMLTQGTDIYPKPRIWRDVH